MVACVKLRGYQVEAVDATFAAWTRGVARPAVVLPTGMGKTVIFAEVIRRFRQEHPGLRVVVLSHRDELLRQARLKLLDVLPAGTPVGVVKAEEDDVEPMVVSASVATLARPERRERLERVGLCVVDECHHAVARTYLAVLDDFGCLREEGAIPALGATATMDRADGEALGRVWQEIVFHREIIWGIRNGWLADIEGRQLGIGDLDLRGVGTTGGDYRDGELGEALEASSAPSVVAQAYPEHARREDGSYLPGVLFAPTVASAHAFAEAMSDASRVADPPRVEVVHAGTPSTVRAALLAPDAPVDVVANVGVLTEGWDSPRTTVCVLARPTASPGRYVQMVGRVLRPHPGKVRALLLDVTGTAGRFPLVTLAALAGATPRKPPRPGQSLLEALEEAEAAAVEELLTTWHEGPVTVEAIDLFGGSRQQWLRTTDGHWFIPAGKRVLVIHPDVSPDEDPRYAVAWYPLGEATGGGWIARGVAELGYAQAMAEESITPDEGVLARKEGRWRARPATDPQIRAALRARIIGSEDEVKGMRAGVLGDLLSVWNASLRVDRPVGMWMRARGLSKGTT